MNATILMPHSTLEYRIVGKKNTSSAQALRTPCPGAWIYMYIYMQQVVVILAKGLER